MRYRAVILDVDGVITPFRSAWQRLHAVLGTDARLNRELYKLNAIDYYEWALYDTLLWLGTPRSVVEAKFQVRRGFEELCSALQEAGVYTIALSAGLGYTRRLSRCFHFYLVNELIYRDGAVYSVAVSVSDRNKAEIAEQVLGLIGVEWKETIAVGDGEADLPILRRAGYPIAFNPVNEEVARAAKVVIRADTLRPLAKYLKALLKRSR